jgi:polar amino acid transport system ATP-binding protein
MPASDMRRPPVVRVRGLHKYYGDEHIIRGVDLDIRPGEVFALAGPSGTGKSTFLRCLNFLLPFSAGTVEIAGITVGARESLDERSRQIRQIRLRAAMVFQDFNLFPHLTILDNVIRAAIAVRKVPEAQATARGETLLDKAGLYARRFDYPGRLSSGEQQQVAIARSLCMEPDVILFDDPTSALDPGLAGELAATMKRLSQEGIAMLIVSNVPALIRSVADWVIFMDGGVWQEITPPQLIFSSPKKERTRRFFEHIMLKNGGAEGRGRR